MKYQTRGKLTNKQRRKLENRIAYHIFSFFQNSQLFKVFSKFWTFSESIVINSCSNLNIRMILSTWTNLKGGNSCSFQWGLNPYPPTCEAGTLTKTSTQVCKNLTAFRIILGTSNSTKTIKVFCVLGSSMHSISFVHF